MYEDSIICFDLYQENSINETKFLLQISLSEENSLHVVKTYPLYLSTINGGIRTEKEFVP